MIEMPTLHSLTLALSLSKEAQAQTKALQKSVSD